jgi:very-short-patch-repair endonuclease
VPAVQITTGRPFRGSIALASDALTRGVLYGPGYRRLYPDIHIAASAVLDFETWSRAAHELVAPSGVLAGYSAAELHGASCGPKDGPAEVILLDGYRRRPGPMLLVHLDAVTGDQITVVDGLRLTTAERTAADLARWAPSLTEAVVAVDALSSACRFDPVKILEAIPPGGRGAARVPRVVALADRRSQSPMETRIRLAIVLAGLPAPVSQHPVVLAGREFALDLAYPEVKLAIEYNGADHLRPDRALRDLEREQLLVAAGWYIIRFGAVTALHYPRTIAARVRQELRASGVPA